MTRPRTGKDTGVKRTLLVAPAVLLAVAGCDDPDSGKDAAPVGTVVEGGTASGTAVTVATPDGRFQFSVAEPTADIPGFDERYDHAAEGASFVGVSWSWDFLASLPVTRTPDQPEVTPAVSVVADGTAYSIDEVVVTDEDDIAHDQSTVDYFGTAWVVVDGEPEDVDDLALRVEFDGLTQEVPVEFPSRASTDRGVARPLYVATDELVRARGTCGVPAYGANGVELDDARCRLSATAVPYHQAVGWVADPDQAWLVVEVSAYPGSVARWRGDRQSYSVGDAVSLDLTVDGQPPVALVVDDPAEGDVTAIFPSTGIVAGSQELVVAGQWRADDLAGDEAGAPRDPVASATWTVPIG